MGKHSRRQGQTWRRLAVAGLMACAVSAAPAMAADGPQIRQVERSYEDVRFDLLAEKADEHRSLWLRQVVRQVAFSVNFFWPLLKGRALFFGKRQK